MQDLRILTLEVIRENVPHLSEEEAEEMLLKYKYYKYDSTGIFNVYSEEHVRMLGARAW